MYVVYFRANQIGLLQKYMTDMPVDCELCKYREDSFIDKGA